MKHTCYALVLAALLIPCDLIAQQILVEGFNDTSATGFPPAGWIMINRDGNTDPTDTAWYQSTTVGGVGGPGPYEGAAFAADYYGSANGFYIDDYLITPNTGGSAPPGAVDSLTFWLASRLSSSGDYPDSLDIRVSTTGRNADDFTIRLDYVRAPKAQWRRFAYALPIAPTRYIAFRYLIYDGGPSGANSDKICLDDVRITRYLSSAVPEAGPLPQHYELSQNYPNPFNPSTSIRFKLKEAGHTTLTVYNVIGERVATVFDGGLTAGTYTVQFDASHLSSGVYYYRLSSGSFVAARAMIVLK
ncbi:MAG TPA: choice-of-anchor J domain-containing protein [Bacteroidota bacterium]|nr:choice-of-anchor J domain-containing protein [Bacteroidota bacterium]